MALQTIPLESEFPERLSWFIRLRWGAGAGVLCLGASAALIFRESYSWAPLLILGGIILIYNLGFVLLDGRLSPYRCFHLQIGLDWISLAYLCHRTGGVESPFTAFFLLHVVLASLFEARRACLFQCALGAALVVGMAALEYSGLAPIPPIPGVERFTRYETPFYLFVFLAAFALVLFVVGFLSSTVMQHLREGEARQMALQEELALAYQELVALDQSKTRFMRTVTHEIRGPLAATASLLRAAVDPWESERSRDFVRRAEVRVLKLQTLLNDLLELVRGGLPLRRENVSDLDAAGILEHVMRDLHAQAAEKGLSVEVDTSRVSGTFRGNSEDLERVFFNLAGNAVKYTPSGGRVRVELAVMDHGELRLVVEDTGIGIPEADLPRIFEEFHRAGNARSVQVEGTGLGLAIVRRTAQKYGGNAMVCSQEGQGTTFRVLLHPMPVDVEPAPHVVPEGPSVLK